MYINDVHIVYYAIALILGLSVGNFIEWLNMRLPEYKKIFTKEYIEAKKNKKIKNNYILMFSTAILYVLLVYKFGINKTIIKNLDLIKYLILTPMLLSAFVIDYKSQIIPNRLNLTIFEIGLIFTFLYGISNVAISMNMLLGMVAGGGIFLAITLIRWIILWKRSNGFW
ncbi:MAG: prepilin peptidase [Clostridia bacterium]|nr:prepilin peptidase [Clostridia bacterium]